MTGEHHMLLLGIMGAICPPLAWKTSSY